MNPEIELAADGPSVRAWSPAAKPVENRAFNLRVGEGMKLILQVFVIVFHMDEDHVDNPYSYGVFGVFAVGLFFQISGYLSGLGMPVLSAGESATAGGIASWEVYLLAWAKWLVRRLVPLTAVMYLLHPFYVFTPPTEEGAPNTFDMVTWTWGYWWYGQVPPPRSYNANTTLWFISVLMLYYAVTPILGSLLWLYNRWIVMLLWFGSLVLCGLTSLLMPSWDSHLRRQLIYCSPASHISLYLVGLTAGILRRQIKLPFSTDSLSLKILIDLLTLISILWMAAVMIKTENADASQANNKDSPRSLRFALDYFGTIPWSFMFFFATEEKQTTGFTQLVEPPQPSLTAIRILSSDQEVELLQPPRQASPPRQGSPPSTIMLRLLNRMLPISCNLLGSQYLRRLCGPGGGSIPVLAYLVHWNLIPWLLGTKRPMQTLNAAINSCLVVFLLATVLAHYVFCPIQRATKKLTA